MIGGACVLEYIVCGVARMLRGDVGGEAWKLVAWG